MKWPQLPWSQPEKRPRISGEGSSQLTGFCPPACPAALRSPNCAALDMYPPATTDAASPPCGPFRAFPSVAHGKVCARGRGLSCSSGPWPMRGLTGDGVLGERLVTLWKPLGSCSWGPHGSWKCSACRLLPGEHDLGAESGARSSMSNMSSPGSSSSSDVPGPGRPCRPLEQWPLVGHPGPSGGQCVGPCAARARCTSSRALKHSRSSSDGSSCMPTRGRLTNIPISARHRSAAAARCSSCVATSSTREHSIGRVGSSRRSSWASLRASSAWMYSRDSWENGMLAWGQCNHSKYGASRVSGRQKPWSMGTRSTVVRCRLFARAGPKPPGPLGAWLPRPFGRLPAFETFETSRLDCVLPSPRPIRFPPPKPSPSRWCLTRMLPLCRSVLKRRMSKMPMRCTASDGKALVPHSPES
mmetsp:Transcript_14846/g.42233  ORF Transcript_14846/g.42233 Transcript_14846/m.42233 type:complete len:414 (+) Transcript_14846:341-1582(+)